MIHINLHNISQKIHDFLLVFICDIDKGSSNSIRQLKSQFGSIFFSCEKKNTKSHRGSLRN